MGGRSSSQLPQQSDAVSTSKPFRLLLVGLNNAGKTTIWKQMKSRYGEFHPHNRAGYYVKIIHGNVLESMKTLIHNNQIQPNAWDAAQRVMSLPDDVRITSDIASDVATLWKDQGIKATFRRHSEFLIPDNIPYFFERANELANDDYVPTDQDIVKCWERTDGGNYFEFGVPGLEEEFNMYESSWCRCDDTNRRLRCYCSKGTRAVLFVVAISEYNEVSSEDKISLLMDEHLNFFTRTVQSNRFADVRFILLFNKVDVFKLKLEDGIPYKWRDYCGPQSYYGITKHVVKIFLSKNKLEREVVPLLVSASEPDFDCMEILGEATGYFKRRDRTSDALNDAAKELLLDVRDIILSYLFVY